MKIKSALNGFLISFCLVAVSSTSQAQSGQASPPKSPASQPIVIATVQTAAAGWRSFEFKYGNGEVLSLVLPRVPKVEVETMNVEKGIEMVVHTITTDTDSTVFVVGYIELVAKDPNLRLTPEMRRELSRSFWGLLADGMREGLTTMGVDAKLTSSEMKSVTIYGREGQEQDFLIGKMPGRYRAVIGERHVYMAMALSVTNEHPDEREIVIQSFKISPAN